jgi:hypothetical protein
MSIIEQLTKPQKRRLARYGCGLCELRLDRTLGGSCGAIFGPRCTIEEINKRAVSCLKASKRPDIADTSKLQN